MGLVRVTESVRGGERERGSRSVVESAGVSARGRGEREEVGSDVGGV